MPALRPRPWMWSVSAFMSGKRALVLTRPCGVALGALEVRLLRARLHRPAVVDVHVLVAVVGEAAPDDRVGGVPHDPVGDVVLPDVPAVPAHVRASARGCRPTTIRNGRFAVPWRLVAVSVTACVPGAATDPLIRPVAGSRRRPAGRPSAAKRIGRSPVAAIVKRKGDPGRTPKTRAPLMRGAGPGLRREDHGLLRPGGGSEEGKRDEQAGEGLHARLLTSARASRAAARPTAPGRGSARRASSRPRCRPARGCSCGTSARWPGRRGPSP